VNKDHLIGSLQTKRTIRLSEPNLYQIVCVLNDARRLSMVGKQYLVIHLWYVNHTP